MLGLVRNQEREEANIAATQNSPPLDLLGEIWGGGFALLLGKRQKEENYYKRHFVCHLIQNALHSNNSHRQFSCDRIIVAKIIILPLLKILTCQCALNICTMSTARPNCATPSQISH